MKTIVARFTEMKKDPAGIVEVDGEEVDVNKVDAALRSVGVSLKNTNGQFRDLDDVFLELAKKWDTLDLMQQRYVATTAAGSRQQSRFIAMMDNYERTMELVNAANNSAGASNEQFSKTTDSLQSKLNRLFNAWNEFTMGLANNTVVKTGVDILTTILETVNNITGAFGEGVGGVLKFGAAMASIKLGKGAVEKGFGFIGEALGTKESDSNDREFRESGEEAGIDFISAFEEKIKNIKSVKKDLQGAFSNTLDANGIIKQFKTIEKQQESLAKASRNLHAIQAKGAGITEREAALAKHTNSQKKQHIEAVQTVQQKELAYQESITAAKAAEKLAQDALSESYKTLMYNEEQLNLIKSSGLTQSQLAIIMSNEESAALLREVVANDALTDAEKREQIAQLTSIAQDKLSLTQKIAYYTQMLFGNQITRQSAAEHLGLATATTVQAGATSVATGAQVALNTAMLACPIGWIVAGVAAIVGAFGIYNAIVETNEEKLERLNKTSSETGDLLQEVTGKISEISDSKNNLTQLSEEMDNLAQGTTEWKQKLLEVNTQVIDLIDKFPDLLKYVNSVNGKLEISNEGWDTILNQQLDSAKLLTTAKMFTASSSLMAQSEIESEKYRTNSEEYQNGKLELDLRLEQQSQNILSNITKDLNLTQANVVANALNTSDFSALYNDLENIKKTTAANSILYSELSGLTLEEVELKRENNELSDDAIKTLIATDKLYKQLEQKAIKLDTFVNQNLKDTTFLNWLSGESSLSKEDIEKITQSDSFNRFKTEGFLDLDKIEDSESFVKEIYSYLKETYDLNETQMEEMGISAEELAERLKFSTNAIINAYSKADTVGIKQEAENFVKSVQEKSLIDLSGEQIKFFSDSLASIVQRGGDIQEFTSLILKLYDAANESKGAEGIKKLTAELISTDFSSVTNVESLINNLEDFGISTEKDVIPNLISATNACNDFATELEKITGSLSLVKQIEDKKGEDDQQIFDKELFDSIEKELGENNPLIDLFADNLDGTYTFIGKLDDLISAINGKSDDIIKATIKANQTEKTISDNFSKLSNEDQSKIISGQFINTNYSESFLSNLKNKLSNLSALVEDTEGLEDDYYRLIASNFTAGGAGYQSFIDANVTDEESFKKWVEKNPNFANALLQLEVGAKGKLGIGQYFPLETIREWEKEQIPGLDISNWYNWESAMGLHDPGRRNDNISARLQELVDKRLITEEKRLELLEKDSDEINQELSQLFSSYSTPEQRELIDNTYKENLSNLYKGKTSAQEILNIELVNPEDIETTTIQLASQRKAIQTLIATHKGYEEKLKNIQKQYKLTTIDAEKYLAIQYETEEAIDKINSITSDYEETLKAQDGSSDYYAALEALTEQAKILFGEDITSEWVEKNLSSLLKLKEGGEEAKAALESLYSTQEAKRPTIKLFNVDTSTFEIFTNTLIDLEDRTEEETEEITSDINKISAALNELNNSDASFEIKANTKAALADLIKTAMIQAVVTENANKFASLYRLALNSDLGIRGASSVLDASVWNGKTTYSLSNKAAEKVNNIRFENVQEIKKEELEIVTNSEGGGKATNDYEDDKNKKDKWENSYDRLYNLSEDINESLREREKLEKEYDRLLEDREASAAQLYENYKAQLENLEKQRRLQSQMADSRRQEIKNTVSSNSDLGSYATYNWEDMTIEINWDNINQVTDTDLGERIEDYISKLEELQGSMDEANDAIDEIDNTVKEIEQQGHDELVDLEQRVMDAIIDREEKKIERLEAIDNSITDGNSKLLDSIQSNLDKLRQDRENQKTEQELAEKEAQLSYLQLDTSGANDLAIAALEKEITQGQQDYTDTLIDQKISELQEQNEEASEERQAQIELMKAQLEVAQSAGTYWNEAYKLISSGTDATGKLLHGSDLTNILKDSDNFSGLSDVQKMDWLSSLEEQAKIATVQYSKENQLEKLGYYANQKVTFTTGAGERLTGMIQRDGSVKVSGNGGSYTYKDVYRAADGTFKTLENYGSFKKEESYGDSGSKKYKIGSYVQMNPNAIIYKSSYGDGGDAQYFSNDPKYKIIGENNGYILTEHHSSKGYTGWFKPSSIAKVTQYKTGGLADFTGPAWLDGTKSSPELVLNQQDTKNFLILKDVLSNLLTNTSNLATSANSGDNYFEINIEVDKLENDYDVDDLANKIKKIITDDSQYRNVNTINFLR